MLFDAEKFASSLLSGVLASAKPEVRLMILDLEKNVEATFAALEIEKDRRRAEALRADLDTYMPVQCQRIGELQPELLDALVAACRTATIVARAFS